MRHSEKGKVSITTTRQPLLLDSTSPGFSLPPWGKSDDRFAIKWWDDRRPAAFD
jgi:hypothetical protein